jgi:hypothetical protein
MGIVLQHELALGVLGCGYRDNEQQSCELAVITSEDWRLWFITPATRPRSPRRLSKLSLSTMMMHLKTSCPLPNLALPFESNRLCCHEAMQTAVPS